ncbi:MAG TPA: ABC transporter permease [Bacillales bacterium]|nr:ABC transporter permease [Bacillales bacterium]
MNAMVTVLREQFQYFYLIRRLSVFEMKITNGNNYLGIFWEILKPMILIAIYAFVFGVGIRGGRDIGAGVAFFPWLLAGIGVWFFFNPALMSGTKSISTKVQMISKMNFPVSVIPTYVIMSKYYAHLGLLVVIFGILQFFGFYPTIYLIQLPYYMFATFAVLFAVCLLTSTLATIIRDVQVFISAVIRILLYLSPILWSPEASDKLSEYPWALDIMKLNPLYYLVEGYRHSLLGASKFGGWYFIHHATYTLYFWIFVFVLIGIGSVLHMKFRNRFVEYI